MFLIDYCARDPRPGAVWMKSTTRTSRICRLRDITPLNGKAFGRKCAGSSPTFSALGPSSTAGGFTSTKGWGAATSQAGWWRRRARAPRGCIAASAPVPERDSESDRERNRRAAPPRSAADVGLVVVARGPLRRPLAMSSHSVLSRRPAWTDGPGGRQPTIKVEGNLATDAQPARKGGMTNGKFQ